MSILQRLKDNIAAIKYALTGEGNKNVLDKYTGFGGINAILYATYTDKREWPKTMLPYWDDIRELAQLLLHHSKDMNEYNRWMNSLRSSVLTAYYTPSKFVQGLIAALDSKAATGSSFLDPAAGSGVFLDRFLDWAYKGQGKVVGYEKDLLTGTILGKRMEHEAEVRVDGFENFPKEELGTYDLVSTNVPFGDIRVFDPDYTNSKNPVRRAAAKYIHRYYVLKGLDCLRDGGIEAYIITSNYLNHDADQIAEALKEARLIGAYRLANNLFKERGTEVGTDLLVLQKDKEKEGVTADESFLLTPYLDGDCPTNMYFTMHPDHIIATETKVGTDAYGKPGFVYHHEFDVQGISKDMRMMLSKDLTENLDVGLFNTRHKAEKKAETKQQTTHTDTKDEKKAKELKAILDTYDLLYVQEATTMTEDVADRKQLNKLYDAWVKKYGQFNCPLNRPIVKSVSEELLALEVRDGSELTKADIFFKPVAFATDEIHEAGTPQEALAVSLNDKGYPDMPYMMALTGLTERELLTKLDGDVYYNPLTNGYEIAAKFISGDVVEKAKEIRTAYGIDEEDASDGKGEQTKTIDPRVTRSLRALEDAVPTPIPFEELDFNLGERWISCDLYSRFGSEFFSVDGSTNERDHVNVDVKYDSIIDQFSASADGAWNEKIHTQYAVSSECSDVDGIDLFIHALQDTCPKLWRYKRDSDGEIVYNDKYEKQKEEDPQAIQMANAKIAEIRTGWVDWLTRQSKDVKDALAKEYNEKFNCFVKPHYDGSHQRFPGLDRKALEEKCGVKDLYQSQKDCVWMLVQNQGGICDHEVLRP